MLGNKSIFIFCFLLFITATFAKGTLHVDTIFSSSESRIIVDNLVSSIGETSDVETREVEFATFASLGITAPELDFTGSYVDISVVNDVNFNGFDIVTQAGDTLDINSRFLSFTGSEITFASGGGISLLSRDTVSVFGETVDIISEGGSSFTSLAGDVTLDGPGDISIDSIDAFSIRSNNDIQLASIGNGIYTADNIYLMSENNAIIDSSDKISMVSSVDTVKLDSHDLSVTVGSLSANGGGQALIESLGDELSMYGFTGVTMTAFGDINAVGESDGVTFISSSTDEGGVILNSQSGSANFISSGASGHSSVDLDASEIFTNSNSFSISANSDTLITGDRNIDLNTISSTSFNIQRDAYVYNEKRMAYDAGTSFGITADIIAMTSDDGAVRMTGLLADTNVGNLLSMTSSDLRLQTTTGDFVINAGGDFAIKGDFTDGRKQTIDISSTSFTFGDGDLDLLGGSVTLEADDIFNFSSNEDLNIQAMSQQFAAEVYFDISGDLEMNGSSWVQTTGNVLFANSDLMENAEATFSFNDMDIATNNKQDINFYVGDDLVFISNQDVEFEVGRDYTLKAQDNIVLVSLGQDVTLNTSDFFGTSDVLLIQVEDNDDIILESNSDFMLITDRNAETNDLLSFTFTGEANIDSNEVYFVSEDIGQFFSQGGSIDFSGDSIALTGGITNNFVVSGQRINFEVGNTLTVNGNSLQFISGNDIFITPTIFDLSAASRGIDVSSDGTLDIDSVDFTITASGEVLFISELQTSITTDTFSVEGSENNWIHSDSGDINISAGSDINLSSTTNFTITTGENDGDSYVQGSLTSSITAFDLFAMNVAETLSIFAQDGLISWDNTNYSLMAKDSVSISSNTLSMSGNVAIFDGGEMRFTSSSIDLESVLSTTISSSATSVSNNVFDDENDSLIIQSLNQGMDINNTGDEITFDAFSLTIESFGSGVGSSISMTSGDNLLYQSSMENQDIYVNAGTTMSISSALATQFTADGDFMMTADDGISFSQSSFQFYLDDNIAVVAELSSLNVDSTGTSAFGIVFVNGDLNGNDVERENTMEFSSTMDSTYTSNNGINISGGGSSESRRETAGDSNSHQHIDQLVSISSRTYDEQGHIIFDAIDSSISWDAGQQLFFESNQRMTIESLNSQTYQTSGDFSMVSEDGSIYWSGATGITFEGASDDLFFSTYGYSDFLAKQDIMMDVDDDIDIVSYHSDINVNTFSAGDLNVNASRFSNIIGGSELNVFAQGSMNFTSSDEFDVTAERGYSLQASGDFISFTSLSTGSVIESSEEIYILSGGDLIMSNPGANNENMRFEGDSGIVFTTTGGDLTFSALTDTIITGDNVLVHAYGNSAGKRDRVYFNSPDGDILFRSINDGIFIDATEDMIIGTSTNPSLVTFNAQSYINVKSVGDIDYTTNDTLSVIGNTLNITSTAGTTFSSGLLTELNSAIGSIRFITNAATPSGVELTDGSINLNSVNLTQIVDNGVFIEALHENTWETGNMFWDVVDISGFVSYNSGRDMYHTIGQNYTITANNKYHLELTDEEGEMQFDIADDWIITYVDEFGISAFNDLELFFDGAITWTILDDLQILSNIDNSNVFFETLESMSFTSEASTMFFNANIYSFVSGTNSVSFTAFDDISLLAKNAYTTGSNDYTINAPLGASFTLGKEFLVDSGSDISFVTTTLTSISSYSTYIETQLGGDSDIDFGASNSITITGFGTTDFIAGEQFDSSADTSMIITSAIDLMFVNDGVGGIDITIPTSHVYTAFDLINFIAGDDSSSGSFLSDSSTSTTFTVSDTLTITGTSDGTSMTSSVLFEGLELTLTSPTTSFTALSSPQGEQGTFLIEASTSILLTSDDTINYLAMESGIEIFSNSDASFVSGADFIMNTDGQDAGIEILSNQVTLQAMATVSVDAGERAKIVVQDNSFISTTTGTTNLQTNGPAADGSYGVRFLTSANDAVSSFTASGGISFNVPNGNFRSEATDLISLTGTTSVTFTADDIDIISQGVRESYNTITEGITIIASTLSATSTGRDIIVHSESEVAVIGTNSLTLNAPTTLFAAGDDIELDVNNVITTTNMIFETDTGGIQFFDTALTVAVAGGDIVVNSGVGNEESQTIFTNGNGNLVFSATAPTTEIYSGANILQTGYSAQTFDSADDIFLDAFSGDMLFRSITVQGPGDGPYDLTITATNDVFIEAFERIEHRQHDTLAFFDTPNQNFRTATEAPVQTTTVPTLPAGTGNSAPNGCVCNQGFCSNVQCPETTARILQMQRAFIDYGDRKSVV